MRKIIILGVVILPVLAFFCFGFFIKAKIICSSQIGNCPEAVAEKLNTINGKSLFRAHKDSEKILKASYMVSSFAMQYKLPNIIKISIVVKKPVFAIKSINSEKYALVDKYGSVLAESDKTSLPYVVTSEVVPNIGEKVKDNELTALMLIDGLNKMYQTTSGRIEGDTLLVELVGPVRVIFPLVDADRELLLGSVRLIYSNIQSADNGTLYKEIDLRYENPVLR